MATISPVVVSSIANACWRACKSHPIIRISASFGPSTVRVNTETVYSDRREAGVVMTSIILITLLKAGSEKGYSLSVGFLFQEEGAPLPAQILAGQCRGRAP